MLAPLHVLEAAMSLGRKLDQGRSLVVRIGNRRREPALQKLIDERLDMLARHRFRSRDLRDGLRAALVKAFHHRAHRGGEPVFAVQIVADISEEVKTCPNGADEDVDRLDVSVQPTPPPLALPSA